jgi:hypothetical protein
MLPWGYDGSWRQGVQDIPGQDQKYESGIPEESLKWWTTLNEQMKNHGYSVDYEMAMNLAHEMLAGRGLETFLSEWQAQESKNKTHKDKQQPEYKPHQIYDCAMFELVVRAFDIQSGWR